MKIDQGTHKKSLFIVVYGILLAVSLGLLAYGALTGVWILLVLGILATGTFLYGRYVEPCLVQVQTYTHGEGPRSLRVVFLSDFHAGSGKTTRFYAHIAKRVRALEPDLLVFGGDFVDEALTSLPLLDPLFAWTPRLGSWFVLGNHDFIDDPQQLVRALEQRNVRDLTNASRSFALADGRSCELVGLDDSLFGAPDLRLVASPKTAAVRVIVTHEPDLLLDLPDGCADIVLLGHTHGGQIRLPVRGPVTSLPQIAPQWLDMGEKEWRGMRVLISRGIGEVWVKARLGARPEILVLDIG